MIKLVMQLVFLVAVSSGSLLYAQQLGTASAAARETGLPYLYAADPAGREVLLSYKAKNAYLAAKGSEAVFNSFVKLTTPSGDIYVLPEEKDTYISRVYEPAVQKLPAVAAGVQGTVSASEWEPQYMNGFSHPLAYYMPKAQDVRRDDEARDFEAVNGLFHKNLVSWLHSLQNKGLLARGEIAELSEISDPQERERVSYAVFVGLHGEIYNTLAAVSNQAALKAGVNAADVRTGTPLDMDRPNAPWLADGKSLFDVNPEVFAQSAKLISQAIAAVVSEERFNYQAAHGGSSAQLSRREKIDSRMTLAKEARNAKRALRNFQRTL